MNIKIEKYHDGYAIYADNMAIQIWDHEDPHGDGLVDAIAYIVQQAQANPRKQFTIDEEEVY